MNEEPRTRIRVRSEGTRGSTVVEAFVDGEWRGLPGITSVHWAIDADEGVATVTLTGRSGTGLDAEGLLERLSVADPAVA